MSPDPNQPKLRVEFGKTLAFYVDLAERLEVIDKQFVEFEAKILGRSEPTNREYLNNESKKDIAINDTSNGLMMLPFVYTDRYVV